jgi:hypothetical protein
VNGSAQYSKEFGNSTGSGSVSVSVNEGDTVELVARLEDSADSSRAYIDAEVDVSTLRIQ